MEKPRVLVVEDLPENIHALAAILAEDASVVFALSGEQALARMGEGSIDLVLLDAMLPGMDGFEVCTRLKANPATRDVPVIFVSALSQSTEEERGFRVGAVDYVHKPFMPTIVRARVRTHLKLRQLLLHTTQLAGTDPLTGIGNRRFFESRVEAEIELLRRHGSPLALALFDVDHFKQVNDSFGHVKGDEVLREIAERATRGLRRSDVFCRWGGEEFALLMPSTTADEAVQICERLRQEIASVGFEGVGPVTVSAGIGDYKGEALLNDWMERVDGALYVAKSTGRNRVQLG
jgi:diguanylate cyclase (GGDEF)-like protein